MSFSPSGSAENPVVLETDTPVTVQLPDPPTVSIKQHVDVLFSTHCVLQRAISRFRAKGHPNPEEQALRDFTSRALQRHRSLRNPARSVTPEPHLMFLSACNGFEVMQKTIAAYRGQGLVNPVMRAVCEIAQIKYFRDHRLAGNIGVAECTEKMREVSESRARQLIGVPTELERKCFEEVVHEKAEENPTDQFKAPLLQNATDAVGRSRGQDTGLCANAPVYSSTPQKSRDRTLKSDPSITSPAAPQKPSRPIESQQTTNHATIQRPVEQTLHNPLHHPTSVETINSSNTATISPTPPQTLFRKRRVEQEPMHETPASKRMRSTPTFVPATVSAQDGSHFDRLDFAGMSQLRPSFPGHPHTFPAARAHSPITLSLLNQAVVASEPINHPPTVPSVGPPDLTTFWEISNELDQMFSFPGV